jgi:hypothetical protein
MICGRWSDNKSSRSVRGGRHSGAMLENSAYGDAVGGSGL